MENYDAIIRAREAIKRKFNELRRGEIDTATSLEKRFKPITAPLREILQKQDGSFLSEGVAKISDEGDAVDIKEENGESEEIEETGEEERERVKEEEEEEEDQYDDSQDVDLSVNTYVNENFGPMAAPYIREMLVDGRDFDHTYGVRQGEGGQWTIGNKVVTFRDDDVFEIGEWTFTPTPGLLELIFKKDPQSHTEDDRQNYKRILVLTDAHRRGNKPSNPINNNRSEKFSEIIKPLLQRKKNQAVAKTTRSKSSSPPKEKVPKKDWRRSLKTTSIGSGVFVPSTRRTYIYWDDPNELVERLNLLVASRRAGHTGHDREILSIEEELREGAYIL